MRRHARYNDRHHTEDGFQNPDAPPRDASPWETAAFLTRHTLGDKQHRPPPPQALHPDSLHRPDRGARLTWLGHATVLGQMPGLTWLTDPVFTRWASPVPPFGPQRLSDAPIAVDDLPGIDLVLLSHDHYDHLDRTAVEQIETIHRPLFAAPLGAADRLRRWGCSRVISFDWWHWERFTNLGRNGRTAGLRLHCLPAVHFSGRTLFDRNSTLWCSWMIEPAGDAPTIYFAGDTAAGAHFEDVRSHIGAPDATLMPIGAYQPRSLMQAVHVSPTEAVESVLDVGARDALPIHWGTYDMAEEAAQDAPADLEEAARERGCNDRWHVVNPGETVALA
jgi:L-ascorbate metabolism protein UlaG (beta-lactamase superfamily)